LSLVNRPCKIKLIDAYDSIFCYSIYSPSFGGGYDIYICDNANTTAGSYSNLGVSYRHPQPEQGESYRHPQPEQGESYLAGSEGFLLSEIEVYQKERSFFFQLPIPVQQNLTQLINLILFCLF
jgi:hypothetical protein